MAGGNGLDDWDQESRHPKGSMYISEIYHTNFEWQKWVQELPFLNFPSHWDVKIIPAFVAAVIRFKVRLHNSISKKPEEVSIYFDGYNNLGHMPGPHWEIYPNDQGDNERFMLGEEDEMIAAISESLRSQESKNDN